MYIFCIMTDTLNPKILQRGRDSTHLTMHRKIGHNAAPFRVLFLHLSIPWLPGIELFKFYNHKFYHCRCMRPIVSIHKL